MVRDRVVDLVEEMLELRGGGMKGDLLSKAGKESFKRKRELKD